MAIFATNFSEYADETDLIAAGVFGSTKLGKDASNDQHGQFTVRTEAGLICDKYARRENYVIRMDSHPGSPADHALPIPSLGSASTIRAAIRALDKTESAFDVFGLVFHMGSQEIWDSGATPSVDGYFLYLENVDYPSKGHNFHLSHSFDSHDIGQTITFGDEFALDASEPIWALFDVSASAWRAKAWNGDLGDEPAGWHFSYDPATYAPNVRGSGGGVGLYGFGDATGFPVYHHDVVLIATDGDAAGLPGIPPCGMIRQAILVKRKERAWRRGIATQIED